MRYEKLLERILDQRKWIESCENNGVSYADGERGRRIREADMNELRRLEAQLVEHRPPRR